MKNIVEPQGSFILVDPYSGDTVQHARPSVVQHTHFIEARVSSGQLKILGVVNDDATDTELVKFLQDSAPDKELALASFLSAFPIKIEEPAEAIKPKAKK